MERPMWGLACLGRGSWSFPCPTYNGSGTTQCSVASRNGEATTRTRSLRVKASGSGLVGPITPVGVNYSIGFEPGSWIIPDYLVPESDTWTSPTQVEIRCIILTFVILNVIIKIHNGWKKTENIISRDIKTKSIINMRLNQSWQLYWTFRLWGVMPINSILIEVVFCNIHILNS